MTTSLRRTLAVRFALTMAVALLGISMWAYLGMRRTLEEQLDLAIRTTFEHEIIELAREGRLLGAPADFDQWRFLHDVNRLVVLRDSTGRVVLANVALARDLELDTVSFRAALGGERATAPGEWKGERVRSLYGPAPNGTVGKVLQVAATLEPLENLSPGVLERMVGTVLLGSLASLVGAWWLARSALTPVAEIADQATRIHGGSAGQRITAHVQVAELRGLINILNEMLGRLDRSAEWHRRIIRDLGHDLRTPITTLRASVEMALRGERAPDDYRRILVDLHEEIERLVVIGDAMSLLGHLESGDLTPVLTPVDLHGVVAQAVERVRVRGGGDNVRFTPAPGGLRVTVDARLFGLVLDQLLDNARRHTPPGTAVDVAAAANDGRVTVTVEDHGPGVPEEILPQLFDRFYRGDSARGRDAGTGLGLTLAAAILDLHRGRISAERGSAGGLRIRIELPA
jgi:signal transduction histidine kinase